MIDFISVLKSSKELSKLEEDVESLCLYFSVFFFGVVMFWELLSCDRDLFAPLSYLSNGA